MILLPFEMVAPFYYVVGAVAAGGAIAWERWNRPEARRKRALKRAACVPIAEVGDRKVVKLVGRISPLAGAAGLVTSPLSQRQCVYARVTVRLRELVLIDAEFGRDFLLRDPTGKALVRLDSAEIDVGARAAVLQGPFEVSEPAAAEFLLSQVGEYDALRFAAGPLTFREAILAAGDTVMVGGPCAWEPDPDPDGEAPAGYRVAPQRLVIAARSESPVVVTDDVAGREAPDATPRADGD